MAPHLPGIAAETAAHVATLRMRGSNGRDFRP